MKDTALNASVQSIDIKRAFVCSGTQHVHYRVCGSGPAVVMLHDSPRSSRLHLPTMQQLARHFTVFALDTPGYGNSGPISVDQPEISDFAEALHAVLRALGLENAPLYATHTSAKIALEYAASFGGPPRLILDGLSIPKAPTPPAFIQAYMRPFRKDDAGGFIANEWTRIRDMLRWFPWFDPCAGNRMQLEVTPEWIQEYTIDLFAAGPHYSDAYAAAMRYDPLSALKRVCAPTVVGARADDVLFESLQRVPTGDNSKLATAPLPADKSVWLDWLIAEFKKSPDVALTRPDQSAGPSGRRVYVQASEGQMCVYQYGDRSSDTVLVLDTPTIVQGQQWAKQLESRFHVILPELPGLGESDPLTTPSTDAFVEALVAAIDALANGSVTILATGLSAPLAIRLAADAPDRVKSLIIDGGISRSAFPEAHQISELTPHFEFSYAGTHLHEIWQMLRDSQASWPWHDRICGSHRKLQPLMNHKALYDSFLGILKQPEHYGDAIEVCFNLSSSLPILRETVDILFLNLEGDPAFADVESIASTLSNAVVRERPNSTDEAVLIVHDFLQASQGARLPNLPPHLET
ncbi:alpha/beta fold hydrolase [Hyphomonas sp.]|uniref:alpha/beta fold hydrolase n=1 Tax=Hyphomonas sp. TaxID=87 RepID=UPI0030F54EC3